MNYSITDQEGTAVYYCAKEFKYYQEINLKHYYIQIIQVNALIYSLIKSYFNNLLYLNLIKPLINIYSRKTLLILEIINNNKFFI